MFEASVLSVITVDATLISYLSTHKEAPSMFFNSAPEGVDFNYLVFDILDEGNEDDPAIDLFVLTFSLFGYSKSGADIQDAAKRIVELLDHTHLSSSYYDTIRIYKREIRFIPKDDPKAQHYRVSFDARAGRSGWMNTLT